MPADIRWIYSHFIHTPGSVGRYASELTGLPWSVSAHAKDIWTSPDWELSEKLDAARWTVTCTAGGAAHLAALAPEPERVRLVYHGLDLSRFPRPASQGSARTGGEPDDPVRILSVGRAVAKKGLDTLADALALLPSDLHWRWTHIGGGELADTLRTQIAGLGLADRVEIHGSRPQAEILAAYRAADLFALPCRIAASGDRDGLPNVIVEAGSQNLAVISTPISGIPELIEDGRNGILVPPDDVRALADALLRLARDPVMRDALGQALGETVHGKFSHRRTIGALVALLDQSGVRERTGAIAS